MRASDPLSCVLVPRRGRRLCPLLPFVVLLFAVPVLLAALVLPEVGRALTAERGRPGSALSEAAVAVSDDRQRSRTAPDGARLGAAARTHTVVPMLIALAVVAPAAAAQPPPPAPAAAPLDGGLGLLALAGGAYAVKRPHTKE